MWISLWCSWLYWVMPRWYITSMRLMEKDNELYQSFLLVRSSEIVISLIASIFILPNMPSRRMDDNPFRKGLAPSCSSALDRRTIPGISRGGVRATAHQEFHPVSHQSRGGGVDFQFWLGWQYLVSEKVSPRDFSTLLLEELDESKLVPLHARLLWLHITLSNNAL